jgi:dUTP pyrophosphatase
MQVAVQRVHEKAVLPTYAHDTDACFDLTAATSTVQNGQQIIDTGLVFAIPPGHVGLIFPRSSISNMTGLVLANSVGVIDASYRGTVQLRFRGTEPYYQVGQRCGQMLIIPRPTITLHEVDNLDPTARGTGGFGSTGQ